MFFFSIELLIIICLTLLSLSKDKEQAFTDDLDIFAKLEILK